MASKKKKIAKSKPAAKATKAKPKAKAKAKVKPVPDSYPTLSTTANVPDARAAIEFCKNVFGAKLRMLMPDAHGKVMHSELKIGNSVLMFSDAVTQPIRTASLMMYVKDVDQSSAKAVAAGARLLYPVMDMFWGDRVAMLADPQGNQWMLATHIEDVTPKQMKIRGEAFAKQMAERGDQAAPLAHVEA